jgi:hypothetical protein
VNFGCDIKLQYLWVIFCWMVVVEVDELREEFVV